LETGYLVSLSLVPNGVNKSQESGSNNDENND